MTVFRVLWAGHEVIEKEYGEGRGKRGPMNVKGASIGLLVVFFVFFFGSVMFLAGKDGQQRQRDGGPSSHGAAAEHEAPAHQAPPSPAGEETPQSAPPPPEMNVTPTADANATPALESTPVTEVETPTPAVTP